ncbi:hypothetical protein [Microlunatus speluncae]|uniref:hypothetical protein n=1 Tax=Microlunatus speluncae TaxID=2594267 RepID=UPI00126612F7|nr:hypothetical protein [Microlunatus speluncae]
MPAHWFTRDRLTLLIAAGLLGVEALGTAAFAIFEISQIRFDRIVVGGGTVVLLIGYAILLGATARGVFLGRRWSRGPAVATQLLQLPVAWSFRGGTTDWIFYLLAGVSLVALVCLVVPASTRHFLEPDPSSQENPPAS